MLDFKEIWEGWTNHLFPPEKLEEYILSVSEDRMNICNECKYNSRNRVKKSRIRFDIHCTVCGCTLVPKTKCLSCHCPKDYWNAIITEEQEEELYNIE